MEKQITIAGMTLAVTFCMATEVAYEDIMDEPFDITKIIGTKKNLSLGIAAILSVESNKEKLKDIEITSEIMHKATPDEFRAMTDAVGECMLDFFHIPVASVDHETAEQEESMTKAKKGNKKKNS